MSQAHQLLDVRKNGAFVFSDILLIDYRQQRLADLLKDVHTQRSHIETLIKRYLKDDQRMVGQEKANIVNILHMLIRNLAALYLRVYDVEHAADFPKIPEVSEGREGYLIKGKMDASRLNVKFSLHDWANLYLESAVQDLTQAFQDAAKDHKITLAEKTALIKKLGNMLTECMQAFYVMRTGAIFK